MSTDVDICNMALLQLKEKLIQNLADGSTNAKYCSVYYDQAVLSTLREANWNFATKRAELARETGTPLFGYTYSYSLPSDYVKLINFSDQTLVFQIEGGSVLCDATSVQMRYVWKNLDPQKFDPLFVDAVTLRLATILSIPLKGDKGLRDRLDKDFKDVKAKAKTLNSQEGTNGNPYGDTWVDMKLGRRRI